MEIAGALLDHTRPDLSEDDETDFLKTIHALAGRLDGAMGRLITADHSVHGIQADLTTLREQRDASTTGVAADIVDLRRHLLFQYKQPDIGRLGLYSPRSYRPAPLLLDEYDRIFLSIFMVTRAGVWVPRTKRGGRDSWPS